MDHDQNHDQHIGDLLPIVGEYLDHRLEPVFERLSTLDQRTRQLGEEVKASMLDRARLRQELTDSFAAVGRTLDRIETGIGRIDDRTRENEAGLAAMAKVCEERGRTCPGAHPELAVVGERRGVFGGLSTRSLLIVLGVAAFLGLCIGLAIRPDVLTAVVAAIIKAL